MDRRTLEFKINVFNQVLNIILILAMIMSVPFILSGDTYIYGLLLLCLAVVISMAVLFTRLYKDHKCRRMLYITLGLWLSIPVSLLALMLGLPVFGTGLEGLSNWALVSFVIGLGASILTIWQLFKRPAVK